VVWFTARRWNVAAGLYAGFILATSLEFLRYARMARVDMALTACLTAAWICLDRALASPLPPPLPLWGFYVFNGLATLAKGPIGLVLPGLCAFTYLAVRGELGRWRTLRVGRGLAVALAIPALWYLLASAVGGMPFVHKQLLRENVLHFVDTGRVTRTRARPFYYYVVALLRGLAPWSIFLLPLGVHLAQIRRRPERQAYVLPLVWCAVVLGFFSLAASKRAVYLLVAYPAAAVLLGAWWSELQQASTGPSAPMRWLLRATVGVAAAAAALILLLLLANAVGLDPLAWIRPLLHRRDQANLPLVRAVLAEQWPIALAWAGALATAAALLLAGARRARWPWVFAALVVATAATAAAIGHTFERRKAEALSYKSFAAEVRQVTGASDRLFALDAFDYGVVFYAGRHVPVVRDGLPDAPAWLILGEKTWEQLPPTARQRLRVAARSEGLGPEGNEHLLLAEVGPP